MKKYRIPILLTAITLISIMVLSGLFWLNSVYAQQNTGMDSFLPRWVGTRLFLINGWSPYSKETTSEIQKMAYGRSARPGEETGNFLYPFYSVLMYAPFTLMDDIVLARALWMTLLQVAILALLGISISLSEWRPSVFMLALLFLLTIFWYHTIRPVLNGNVSVIIAVLIAGALLAIRSKLDALAGILLAFATFKPHLVLPLYLFIVIWAVSRKRWTIIWSLLGSMIILVAAGSIFIPNWILDNLRAVIQFSQSVFVITPGSIIAYWLPGAGERLGWIISGLFIGVLLLEWRAALGQDFRCFLWTALLTIVCTPLIGFNFSLEDFILFYPAILLIMATLDNRWGAFGRWLVVVFMILITFGLWIVILNSANRGVQPDMDVIIYFFMPFLLLLGLFWIRWWAIRPARLPLDEFS